MNEYKIDGFRFHDIPSIIYKNHGKILYLNKSGIKIKKGGNKIIRFRFLSFVKVLRILEKNLKTTSLKMLQ